MTAKPPLADQPARDAIANALDETLVVEAAAGTGKTTELVKRILRILSTGGSDGKVTVGNIVAVTFTEKAAGELKLRLREALEKERTRAREGGAGEEVAQRLDRALGELEEAHVSTIHGFCAELLRERPVEARVDPLFTVLTEAQAERLFDEAFGSWIQAELANPPEGVRRALRRSVWSWFGGGAAREDGPIDRLRRAAWELTQWRDFTASWMRPPFDRERGIDRLIEELHAFAALTEAPSYARDNLFLDTAPARHLSQEIALHQSFEHIDYDGWEARLVDLSRDRNFARARHGRGPGYRQGVPRASVVEQLEQLRAHLDQFRMDADADLAAALQAELRDAIARYENLKRRAGALDFLDLLLHARDLVRRDAGVRRGFQDRFKHIFVDEFQDTDPLQAEILLLLAAEDPATTDWRTAVPKPGRLFIVGDPKQSIYRFRRADVGIYRDVCTRLERYGAKLVKLTTSFRSVPGIQSTVNAAFAPAMTGDAFTLQADYVPLSPFRDPARNQPSVVALPVPSPYGSRNISALAIEASLPDATGAFVDWLVHESEWMVTERTGEEPVPIGARHICILFRRFISFGDDVTMPYVQALEARGVKHVLVGGKTFHDREEVEAVRAALAAIEWPDDELSVFGTLRGALFAFGDDVLLEYHGRARAFHPFRPLEGEDRPPALAEIAQALTLLRDLHLRRNQRPVAATIAALLDASRAHAIFALRPSGEQALANVQYVGELARQYEAGGGLSFRGFVERLREEAEDTRAAEAPILEEGSDGVRLMTVHKAKGLEFPVVVLVDIGAELSRGTASRWVDAEGARCAVSLAGWQPAELREHAPVEIQRDEAEGVRVAYVAATRARDLLVACAVGDTPQEGWVGPLNAALYPPEDRRRDAIREHWAEHFGPDSLVDREDTVPFTSMRPGIHRFAGDEPYDVTWWDPATLDLDRQPTFGLRREELIAKDAAPGVVDDGLEAFHAWKVSREAAVEKGSRPTHRVVTVRARAASAPAAAPGVASGAAPGVTPDVRIETIPRPAGIGQTGTRFGALVHALLALVPFDALPSTVDALAAQQARVLAADPAETEAAARVVDAALRHPVFAPLRAAAAAGGLRREVPVALAEPGGAIVEGVVDAAFETPAGWVVVDFKTDADPAESLDAYLGQVRLYARAVETATGRPTSAILLRL
jgi:ATP-dependent exoDNAse (exonuclease V) beta subunit